MKQNLISMHGPLTFLLCLLCIDCLAQVRLQWARTYNDSANGEDNAAAIALDRQGNVYVAGFGPGQFTPTDYTIVKYDSTGNHLWTRRHISPVSYTNYARSIAIDQQGNYYVTGTSSDSGFPGDYLTVKYDSMGHLLWERKYNGPSSSYDFATSVAVDLKGQVYVTGASYSDSTLYDYLTIKYDSSGNLLWKKSYNGPANGIDWAYAVFVDSFGNLYVTGGSQGKANDYATIKYDSLGSEQWVKRYNSTSDGDDVGYSVAVDPKGYVYVTGTSMAEYLTLKYNRNGQLLWEKRDDGPDHMGAFGIALELDPAQNVYVTGTSFGNSSLGTTPDFYTLKYNTDGQQLWTARYDSPSASDDYTNSLVLDNQAHIYITGFITSSSMLADFLTIRYDQEVAISGLCCFTGPDGQKAVCGPHVNQNNCQTSGKNAFFLGTVDNCALVDTATACARSLTPVTLSANYVEGTKSVLLSWQLGQEHKTTGYFIQRSRDGQSFKNIGFMPSNPSGNYSFSDVYPLEEGYYKLVWFESRGFESEMVLAVALPKGKLQLVPNPASTQVTVLVGGFQKGAVLVSIYDLNGRLLVKQSFQQAQSCQVNISTLQEGTYILKAEQEGETHIAKLIKE